jgi:hypothetical protein
MRDHLERERDKKTNREKELKRERREMRDMYSGRQRTIKNQRQADRQLSLSPSKNTFCSKASSPGG